MFSPGLRVGNLGQKGVAGAGGGVAGPLESFHNVAQEENESKV